MSDRNVNPRYIYVHYIFLIHNLHTVPTSDANFCKLDFVFLFTYSKMQSFLTDVSLLVVF